MKELQLLSRISSPLDEILGKKLPVLDDGFVRVVDYMGDDSSIVQAARVSYGKGTKKISEDEGLIRYLLRHSHTTPFEMCELKLHVRVPMDCWRQWIRHRSASVNEYSTRYSEAIDACQTTPIGEWRTQAKTNKQGSGEYVADSALQAKLSRDEKRLQRLTRKLYEGRLSKGVAKEQARKDLNLSTYTEAYWKIDLHNLLHFLSLRMDKHAQKEIRDYATVIGEQIVARWVPLAWAAFNDYNFRRKALLLSSRDVDVIAAINCGDPLPTYVASSFGWLEVSEKTGQLKSNREREEFEGKLERLGLVVPW